jgi:hypothetical protein
VPAARTAGTIARHCARWQPHSRAEVNRPAIYLGTSQIAPLLRNYAIACFLPRVGGSAQAGLAGPQRTHTSALARAPTCWSVAAGR